jgi:hypothetical protein
MRLRLIRFSIPRFGFLYFSSVSRSSAGEIPPPFDYFVSSLASLLAQALEHFNVKPRFRWSLIIMIWDIMGLALSCAIALAAA